MRTIMNCGRSLTNVITLIGYAALAYAVLMTTINVIGRYILKRPLLGEVDMVEMGMAVFGGVAMFLTTTNRHHVSVDVLVVRFSRRTQTILRCISSLLGSFTWGVLAYLTFLEGLELLEKADRTDVLRIPHAPFAIILAVGLCLVCMTMLKQALRPGVSEDKEDGEGV